MALTSLVHAEFETSEFSLRKLLSPLTHAVSLHIIVILGLVVYINSVFNGFVGDDFGQLVDNPAVHSISNIPHFFFGGTFNNGSGAAIGIYYKPLMMTLFAVLYSLSGGSAWLFHVFQILLHIANSVMVYFLFCYFFKKPLSLFLSLVFLLHPINSEVVFYVSDLQDGLFFFFGISATILLLRARSFRDIWSVLGLLVCSLLSKTTGLVFIPVLLAITYFWKREYLKTIGISLLGLVIAYVLLHVSLVGTGFSHDQPFPIMRVSFAQRLLNIPSILMFYFTRFFFPKDLAIGYQGVITQITVGNFWVPLLGIVTFLLGIVALFILNKQNKSEYQISKSETRTKIQMTKIKKRFGFRTFGFVSDFGFLISNLNKTLFLFTLWLLVGLGMHIQLIPLDFTVAERWFYFPVVGLLGIVGVVGEWVGEVRGSRKLNVIFAPLAIVILLVLAGRTVVRSFDWRNGLTLAAHDTKVVTDSYSLYAYYGVELFNAGKYDDAIVQFTKSTDLAPYWFLNWNYLGQAQERKGTLEKNKALLRQAKASYETSLKNGKYEPASVNYAHFLVYHESNEQAKMFISQSLKTYPYSSELWYNQALLSLLEKDSDAATLAAQKAYQYDPSNADAARLFLHLQQNQPVTIQKDITL